MECRREKQLSLRAEVNNEADEEGGLARTVRRLVPAIEVRYTGPVAAELSTGQKAFLKLDVAGCGELLKCLRPAGYESVPILVPVVTGAECKNAVLQSARDGESVELVGSGAWIIFRTVVEVD